MNPARIPHQDGQPGTALKVADMDELVGWFLSFGSRARVLRGPNGLRQQVREEAEKILRS
ncbi:MAG: WYL domain-containing protein [Candidatus Binatia bacterium]